MAVAICGLLLWTLRQWGGAGGGLSSDTPGLLFPRGLGEVDSLIVERGAFRMDLRWQDGRWRQMEPFAAEVDQVVVRRMLDALAHRMPDDAPRPSNNKQRARVLLSGGGSWYGGRGRLSTVQFHSVAHIAASHCSVTG